MRSLMRARCAWSSSRICLARFEVEAIRTERAPGQVDHPLEIAAHHLGLGPVGVHALETAAAAASPPAWASGGRPASSSLDAILGRPPRGAGRPRRAPTWIARSCSRRKCLALAAGHLVLGLATGSRPASFVTSSSRRSRESTLRSRASGSTISRTSWASSEPQLQVRGDQVGEPARLVHVGRDREHLGREVLERQQLLDAASAPSRISGLDLDGPLRLRRRPGWARRAPRWRGSFSTKLSMRALHETLHQRLHAAVGQAQDAHHHARRCRRGTDRPGSGSSTLGVALRGQQHQAVAGQGVLDRRDRALARRRRAAAPCRGRPRTPAAGGRAAPPASRSRRGRVRTSPGRFGSSGGGLDPIRAPGRTLLRHPR